MSNILYYVSSHGFGHAVRAAQVIYELNKSHNVYIKTKSPKWIFKEILNVEPLYFYEERFDVGCIQEGNFDVDVTATFKAYKEQSQINKSNIHKELTFIKENHIDLIVSDIASFPFVLAKEASVQSVFIGNFTWKGIYQYYIKDNPVIDELDSEYSLADHALLTPLSMDTPELKNQNRINLIARKGVNIRDRLNKIYGISGGDRLVFLYLGCSGMGDFSHNALKKIEGYTFLSFYPLSIESKNFIVLERGLNFRHQDITASSDIVFTKPGYGMISEALVNGIPMVYPPREEFVEYFTFLKEFESSGGTEIIGSQDFKDGNWQGFLDRAYSKRYKKIYQASGAIEAKEFIETLL